MSKSRARSGLIYSLSAGVALLTLGWVNRDSWRHLHPPTPEDQARQCATKLITGQGGDLYRDLVPWEANAEGMSESQFRSVAAWIGDSYRGYHPAGIAKITNSPDRITVEQDLVDARGYHTTFELEVIHNEFGQGFFLIDPLLSALHARYDARVAAGPLHGFKVLQLGLKEQTPYFATVMPKGLSQALPTGPAMRSWAQWNQSMNRIVAAESAPKAKAPLGR